MKKALVLSALFLGLSVASMAQTQSAQATEKKACCKKEQKSCCKKSSGTCDKDKKAEPAQEKK